MNIIVCAWQRVVAATSCLGRCISRFFTCLFSCEAEKNAPDRNTQLAQHLLAQYRDEFIFARQPTGDEVPVKGSDAIVARIADLFGATDNIADKNDPDTNRRRWEWAYEIERLLVYVKPHSKLVIDVDRRIDDVKRMGLPSADKYRAQLDALNARLAAAWAADTAASNQLAGAKPEDQARLAAAAQQAKASLAEAEAGAEHERRSILAAVLDDIQWQAQKTVLVRGATWDSALNLLRFGLITMLIVTLPFICFMFEKWTGLNWFSKLIENFPNYGLYTAMSFGLLGAYFSRLTSLSFAGNLTLEDAENRYSLASLMIRGGVGTCGALLFYFLMRSGVLGAIAPDYQNFTYSAETMRTVLTPDWTNVLIPSKDWSLLVLYSFLAGFSEKLVSDSLTKVEATVSGKKT